MARGHLETRHNRDKPKRPTGKRGLLTACMTFGLLVFNAFHADAAPTLRIRGQARLTLDFDERGVWGQLTDEQNVPLGAQPIQAKVIRDGVLLFERPLRSDVHGTFHIPRSELRNLGSGEHAAELTITFEGTPHILGRSVARRLRLQDDAIRLHMEISGHVLQNRLPQPATIPDPSGALPTPSVIQIDLADDVQVISAQLTRGDRPVGTRFVLRDDLGHILREADAPGGTVLWELPSRDLGGPGAGALVLTALDEEGEALAILEQRVVRVDPVHLSLAAESDGSELSPDFSGVLFTARGPLRRRAVTLYRQRAQSEANAAVPETPVPLGTTLTDANGVFHFAPTDEELPPGQYAYYATFESDGPARPSARSNSVTISQTAPTGWFAGTSPFYFLPLGLLLGLLWYFRRPAPALETEVATAGAVLAKKAALRRSRRIQGQLLDLHGDPVMGRLQAVDGSGDAQFIDVDDEGVFDGELPPGTWKLVALEDDHMPAEVSLTVPHQGEYEGFRVFLEARRDRPIAVVRRAVEALDGRPVSAQTTVHALRPHETVGPLAAKAEEIAYGASLPNVESVRSLEAQTDEIAGTPNDAR